MYFDGPVVIFKLLTVPIDWIPTHGFSLKTYSKVPNCDSTTRIYSMTKIAPLRPYKAPYAN